MKWHHSILEVVKTDELKALSKGFIFCFEFRIHRTIKRDANLVGLRKIECSSIIIISKERHSSTSRARRIVLVTFGVGCPDVSRNSRPSEVMTHARSHDAQSLSLCGDCGSQKSRPKLGVLTPGHLASL
jgi:hypothetical protein